MAKTTLGKIQEQIKEYLKLRADVASAQVANSQAHKRLTDLEAHRNQQWREIEALIKEAGFAMTDPERAIALLSEGVVGHTRSRQCSAAQEADGDA